MPLPKILTTMGNSPPAKIESNTPRRSRRRAPLPAGEYKLDRKELWAFYRPCNYVVSFDWTITGARAVQRHPRSLLRPRETAERNQARMRINGTLNPSTFSVNGTATEIERIQWNPPGIVKVHLKPSASLSDRHLDFIALNGSRTLRLDFNRRRKVARRIPRVDNLLSPMEPRRPANAPRKPKPP